METRRQSAPAKPRAQKKGDGDLHFAPSGYEALCGVNIAPPVGRPRFTRSAQRFLKTASTGCRACIGALPAHYASKIGETLEPLGENLRDFALPPLIMAPRMIGPVIGTFVDGVLHRPASDQELAAARYDSAWSAIQASRSAPAWSPSSARLELMAIHSMILRGLEASPVGSTVRPDAPGWMNVASFGIPGLRRVRLDLVRIVIGASASTLPISREALLRACDTAEFFVRFSDIALGGYIPPALVEIAQPDLATATAIVFREQKADADRRERELRCSPSARMEIGSGPMSAGRPT